MSKTLGWLFWRKAVVQEVPLPGAVRLARLLKSRSPQERLHDAQEISNLLADPRAEKLFEHAALHVDASWQHANGDQYRYFQGMAAMLNLLSRLPEFMSAQALKEIEAQERTAKQKDMAQVIEELGTVDRGLDWFKR